MTVPDIEKIRVLHDLTRAFKVDDEFLTKLKEQIGSSEKRDQIDRFFAGYTNEDNFKALFSAMPWVKLLHHLDQQQAPASSKDEYQVPDHTIILRTSSGQEHSVLAETKLVSGEKETREVSHEDLERSQAYAAIQKKQLVFPIYWSLIQTWTLNTPDQFDIKSRGRRINWRTALKSDLSMVLGDIMFLLQPPIIRTSVFKKNGRKSKGPGHETYGLMVEDAISVAGREPVQLDAAESAAVDALVAFDESERQQHRGSTHLREQSNQQQFAKVSSWVLRHLGVTTPTIPLSQESAMASRLVVVSLAKKLGLPHLYSIPAMKTVGSTDLFQAAFFGGPVWRSYLS